MKKSEGFKEFQEYVRERMAWQLTNLFFRSIRTKNPLFKREVIGLMKILSLQTHSPPAKKLVRQVRYEDAGRSKEDRTGHGKKCLQKNSNGS